MTETEFLEASEALMQQVENAVDAAELDVECDRTGNVLTGRADRDQSSYADAADVACYAQRRPSF